MYKFADGSTYTITLVKRCVNSQVRRDNGLRRTVTEAVLHGGDDREEGDTPTQPQSERDTDFPSVSRRRQWGSSGRIAEG